MVATSTSQASQNSFRLEPNAGPTRIFIAFFRQITVSVDSPPPGLDLEDVKMSLDEMSLEDRVAEWPKLWIQKSREQDFREGIEHERALLRRQMALRFDADATERVAERLERITAQDRWRVDRALRDRAQISRPLGCLKRWRCSGGSRFSGRHHPPEHYAKAASQQAHPDGRVHQQPQPDGPNIGAAAG